MITIGDSERFAIQVAPELVERSVCMGSYAAWLGGTLLGDSEEWTHLSACVGYLRKLYSEPRDRVEDAVFQADLETAIRLIDTRREDCIPNSRVRFYITMIGMISLANTLELMLVKDSHGNERCLWRGLDGSVGGVYLRPNEMESVAEEFVEAFLESYACRVCGYLHVLDPPDWDETTPSHTHCVCCGVEFGVGDRDAERVRALRADWIRRGFPFLFDAAKPERWSFKRQSQDIPRSYR